MNDDTITYSYDSFSRRLSRTSDQISVQYLYQFDTEIAALENNKIVEFKAIHGQFSPYAIELYDKVYAPIRNHRGDITVLLDSDKNAVSTYRYDAFGEFSHYGSIQSPWLFSSQRYDTSTKNYHFINREYDSFTGRWLTPDPLGFEDGLNLYAYVHNNPMTYVDPYGLWAEDSNGYWSQAREFGHSFSRGFVDDASFGLTSLTMGEHETPNFNSKAAYYTGSACSLGAGLLYGATWVKGAAYTGKGINYGCKLLRNMFKVGSKPLKETLKVVQSTVKPTPVIQVFRQTLGIETKIGKESVEIGKRIWTSTKNRSPVKNAYKHWTAHRNEFPELTNAKQYVERTRELFQSTENTLTKFRSNGEMLRYQPDTNTFGVFTKENIPKTMYRPTEGIYYWLNGN